MFNSFEKLFKQFEKNSVSFEIKFERMGGYLPYYKITAKGICFPASYVITGNDLAELLKRANKDNCDECKEDL